MLPSSAASPPPATASSPPESAGMSPSILIITAIVAIVVIVSASIHLLLRYIARRRRRRHTPIDQLSSSLSSSSVSSSASSSLRLHPADDGRDALIASLPLFKLSSAAAAAAASPSDCAVCLSRLDPDDELRLLPACRHAFHPACVDTWLRSTPSCPLCRAPVVRPDSVPASFRVEIGSVSRREGDGDGDAGGGAAPLHGRAYSLGSSFEYVVDDEIEAVVAAVAAHVRESKDPAAPSEGAAAAAAAGSTRSWLRDYVDRIASSASSSFSSMRFSGRWSRRGDPSAGAGGGSWDLETGLPAEDAAAYYSFYRWLVGT